MCPAVGALRPLLSEPPGHAILATEFRALRTENGVLDFAKADEAFEDLVESPAGIGLRLFCNLILAILVSAAAPIASLHDVQAIAHAYNFIVVVDIRRASSVI